MIKEDYVSFETAKLLKEKGFNLYEVSEWVAKPQDKSTLERDSFPTLEDFRESEDFIELPITSYHYPLITLQTTLKWLREVHKTFIQIDYDYYENDGFYYGYSIVKINTLDDNGEVLTEIGGKMFETYEKACEEAIAYCLTNLVQTLHPDMSYDELCEHYEKENEY